MDVKTIDFYNKKSQIFADETLEVEFKSCQDQFVELLQPHAKILDFGCGSGRDTRYFLSLGFQVEAIDGAKELCKIASKNTGIEVKNVLFQEFCEIDKYDGIWACASLLHLEKAEIKKVIASIAMALKTKGFLYISFKYGDFHGMRHGRYFTDLKENTMQELLDDVGQFFMVKQWISSDARPNRSDEKWLNLIVQKKN